MQWSEDLHNSLQSAHYNVLDEIGGGCADQLFSAAKTQISRILKKFLPDAPAGHKSPTEIQTEQTQVVAAITAFAQFLCADGTAAEAAERLRKQAADSAAARRAAEAAARQQRRNEKAERRAARARGELAAGDGASDLEDDSASEDEGALAQEIEDAEASMLACLSLSKLMKDFVDAHETQPQGRALHTLATNTYGAFSSDEWMQTQVRAWITARCLGSAAAPLALCAFYCWLPPRPDCSFAEPGQFGKRPRC